MSSAENSAVENPPASAGGNSCPPQKLFCLCFAAVLVAGIAVRAWLYATTGFTVGDAFITFRFAEQFAAGNGLVFNAGEWFGGNTSVLHSFLLGLGACSGLDVPTVARIEGIVFDVAAFFVIWKMLGGTGGLRSPWLRLVPLALIFLCPFLFWYSISGLETPLYVALIFFVLERALRALDGLWLLGVALLFFCRPDGIVAVGIVLLFVTVLHRKLPWRAIAGVFAIGVAYLAFNFFVYHSLIPPTVKVKSLVYHCTVMSNVNYISGRFFFHRNWLLAAYLAVMLAMMFWRRKNPKVVLLGCAATGYLLFLLLAPMLRSWYAAPFLALSAATVLLAGFGLLEDFRPRLAGVLAATILAGYLAGCFVADRALQKECGIWRQRIHDLTEAEGNWFKANTPGDTKILVESLEVGWFSKRHTWDWPGLVSPPVLELVKANPKIGFFEIAEKLKVNYVIIHNHWFAVDETNIPPNFEKVATFQSTKTGPVMDYGEGKDFIYQRLHD